MAHRSARLGQSLRLAGQRLGPWLDAPSGGTARLLLGATLRSASSILFTRSWAVGLGLLAGLAWLAPITAGVGIGAAALASGLALLIGMDREVIRAGQYGYSALLTVMGLASVGAAAGGFWALAVGAVVLCVLATAALRSVFSVFDLPVLTIPFLLVFPFVVAAMPIFGVAELPPVDVVRTGLVTDALTSLGALFFLPRPEVGLVIAAALFIHSRIAVLLAAAGYLAARLVMAQLAVEPGPELAEVIGYNAMLVAVAVGGVWFVPSRSSLGLATIAAGTAALLSITLWPVLVRIGWPVLAIPFNGVVLGVLLSMRQRVAPGRLLAADPSSPSPEASARALAARITRFGGQLPVQFHAPFLGRWTCTQGFDGETTHKGAWRHAFDFEILGADGRPFHGNGEQLEDFRCYGLPVVAMADGTVVHIVDDIPDNAVGHTNLTDNWGNLVLIAHGAGLYSLSCHLSPGSLAVTVGQVVRRGERIGLCGSSGRSPRPHLHVHLQGSAVVGAPTLAWSLGDVIIGGRLVETAVVRVGDVTSNVDPDAGVAELFRIPYGDKLAFMVEEPGGSATLEVVVADIDLYGTCLLRGAPGTWLAYVPGPSVAYAYDPVADDGHWLHLWRAALGRVPLQHASALTWTDVLPARRLVPRWLRPLVDMVLPYLGGAGVTVDYTASHVGDAFVVTGTSRALWGGLIGAGRLTTRAVLKPGIGPARIEVTVAGKTRAATRLEPAPLQQ